VNRRPNPFTVKKPRSVPPTETGQEAAFLRALGQNQSQVAIRLVSGETVTGWVEYYDEKMVRLTRSGAPNLFIYKDQIAYIAEAKGKAANERLE
jgi:host factor-I protein